MDPEQVLLLLTVEQRELRALARQTMDIVQFMTRECCERAIQALLPLVQEAVGASEVVVPEGLDEKKGMDLIEAILQRRQGPAAAASKKHKEKKTAEIVVADSPESPKEASKVAPSPIVEKKKRERVLTPKAKASSEVANKKGQGPPRKQSKQLKVAHDEVDEKVDGKVDDEVDDESWEEWDPDTHGSIAGVSRIGVHDDTFGLFITARKNGSGHRTVFPFFADADALKTVDDIDDKTKYRKMVKILLGGIRQCLDGEELSGELTRFLKSSKWGQQVLTQLSNKNNNSE